MKWNSFHPLSSAYRLYVDSGKYQLSLNSQICGWEISEMPFWVRGGRGVLLFKDQWLQQGSRESLCVPLLLKKKKKDFMHHLPTLLFCFQDVVSENLNFPPRQQPQKCNCETASPDKGAAVPRKQMLKCPHMTQDTRLLVWLERAYSFKPDNPSEVQKTTSSTHVPTCDHVQWSAILSLRSFFFFFLSQNIQQIENNHEQDRLLHNMEGWWWVIQGEGQNPTFIGWLHKSWATLPLLHRGSGFLPCLWARQLPQRKDRSLCSAEVREPHSCGEHRLCELHELPGLRWDLRVQAKSGSVVKTRS